MTTLCFQPFPLAEALSAAASAGFDYVEICAVKGFLEHLDPDDLSGDAVDAAQTQLADSGLRASSLSGHSPLHTTEGLERHRRLLAACVQLAVPIFNTAPVGIDDPDDLNHFVRNARKLADDAERDKVTLCLENDGMTMPTAAVGAGILDQIDHSAVRLNYDPANAVFFGGANPLDDIEYALPLLGHLHLKDQRGGKDVADFPPLGEGDLDLAEIMRRVEGSGYDGPVCLEIEFDGSWPDWQGCVDAARQSSAYWDNLKGSW